MNKYETRYVQDDVWQVQVFQCLSIPKIKRFSADDFRLERSVIVEKLRDGLIAAVHKIRKS